MKALPFFLVAFLLGSALSKGDEVDVSSKKSDVVLVDPSSEDAFISSWKNLAMTWGDLVAHLNQAQDPTLYQPQMTPYITCLVGSINDGSVVRRHDYYSINEQHPEYEGELVNATMSKVHDEHTVELDENKESFAQREAGDTDSFKINHSSGSEASSQRTSNLTNQHTKEHAKTQQETMYLFGYGMNLLGALVASCLIDSFGPLIVPVLVIYVTLQTFFLTMSINTIAT